MKNSHHPFTHYWNIYSHLPNDSRWTDKNSYELIMSNVDSAEKLIAINEVLPEGVVKNGMLFVMKGNIFPMWEEPANANGGYFSFKIFNKNVQLVFRHVLYLLCGESLTVNPEDMELINGISISPKLNFCILKIWMCNTTVQDPTIIVDIPNLTKDGCLFNLAPKY